MQKHDRMTGDRRPAERQAPSTNEESRRLAEREVIKDALCAAERTIDRLVSTGMLFDDSRVLIRLRRAITIMGHG